MNIHIFEEFKLVGGQEIYAINLLKFFSEIKEIDSIKFYTSLKGKEFILRNHSDFSQNIIQMPKNNFKKVFFIKKLIFNKKSYKEKRRNIVLCNSFNLSAIIAILNLFYGRYKKKNLFVITHLSIKQFSHNFSLIKYVVFLFLDYLISLSTIRICISKEIYSFYKRQSKKVLLIQNSLPKKEFYNQECLDYTSEIAFIGRLDKQKGIDYLCSLLSILYKENYINRIEIAGSGNLKFQINDLSNLSSKIIYYNYISNPFNKIRSKIVLFPSYYEGFPLSLLEAVYFRNLPITSNIEAFKNILPENYPTLNFNLKKDILLIQNLLKNNYKREKLFKEISYYYNKNFSFEDWKLKWINLINGIY